MDKLNVNSRCPKCGGNLYLDKDWHSWYEECLQCAFMRDLETVYEKPGKTENTRPADKNRVLK
ncbi:MAG: hypothetical protein A2144_00165 [Chloroflexi bacterium RBG_16_50_9]|nr:MAG: hypothetical protein A2144_00165 [Chloroflexi bacterium RBG_16_50_9]